MHPLCQYHQNRTNPAFPCSCNVSLCGAYKQSTPGLYSKAAHGFNARELHQSGQRCLLYQKSGHSRRSCSCSLLSSYWIPTSANRAFTFAGSSQIVGFVTGHCRRCMKSNSLKVAGPPSAPQSVTTSRPFTFFTTNSIVSPSWPPISL